MTHSTEHHLLDQFVGRRVAIVGIGQSSLQTAALLSEARAHVQVVGRARHIVWEEKIPEKLTLLQRIKRPPNTLTLGHRLTGSAVHGNGLRLHLEGPERSTMEADHVIAGTGFRIDVAKLPFLSEEIVTGLVKRSNAPSVNRAGESSIPGLYFAGAHAAVSLGPGQRFIAGTHHLSAQPAGAVNCPGRSSRRTVTAAAGHGSDRR